MQKNPEEGAMIVAQTGPLMGQRWMVRESLIVGREPGCDIVVIDRQVSRHHARFLVTPQGIVLEDLGSKNGTQHNGQPVIDGVLLQDGDTIQIALAQRFIYLSSDATLPLELQEALKTPGQHPTSSTNVNGIILPPEKQLLHMDKRSRRVWIEIITGQPAEVLPPLSVSQFQLLEILYDNPGKVVTRQEIVAAIWGDENAFDVSEQALDALVRRLRTRLASIDPDHVYIVTVRGHGIRLEL